MENEKKVLIPLVEYEDLVKAKEELKKAKEELYKDCEERGLYVKQEVVLRPSLLYDYGNTDEALKALIPRLTIFAKDEVLKKAQEEMERISSAAKFLVKERDEEIKKLKSRSLLERIFNMTAD